MMSGQGEKIGLLRGKSYHYFLAIEPILSYTDCNTEKPDRRKESELWQKSL